MKTPVYFLFTLVFACWLAGCDSDKEERLAHIMLLDARNSVKEWRWKDARDTIMELRRRHPTAVNARMWAVRLLDTVELYSARDSVRHAKGKDWERLIVKVRFYERKLDDLNIR